ncbi:hypothetical protein CK556_01255 [Mesoplasma chauliocola]|uniref:Uncharacterized protein n=1 Tax=Mesoplasma chauliocola TaxID=216427 RepID=A0A249SN09_9MOLU|nr:hypothetical protein [Mesoplasma chauliocola]ASZ08982.1 hypothetical protein CK556_01255 [Mesoplasma chauliocola]
MKKQTNKILILNILNITITLIFSALITISSIVISTSLKQSIVLVLLALPVLAFLSIVIFYLISYKKKKIGITNLLIFMCSLNIFSLLLSFKITSEMEVLDIIETNEEENEKTNLMPEWEKQIEQEKIVKKLSKYNLENKKHTKKDLVKIEEEKQREVYKSYSKYVYKKIIVKYKEEKNTFKLITLTSEAIQRYEYLQTYLKQTKLLNEFGKFNLNRNQIAEIINSADLNQVITTFKENRKNF